MTDPQKQLWTSLRTLNFPQAASQILQTAAPSLPPQPHLTTPSPSDPSLTPLNLSALLGSLETVVALLSANVPPDDTSLQHAARNGHARVVTALLQSPSAKQLDKGAALLEAAWYARTDCVESILSAGVAVNVRADDGASPLHYAALAGDVGMIRALVAAGAALAATDCRGRCAADWAGDLGDLHVIDALKETGEVKTKEEGGLSDAGSDVTVRIESMDEVTDEFRRG